MGRLNSALWTDKEIINKCRTPFGVDSKFLTPQNWMFCIGKTHISVCHWYAMFVQWVEKAWWLGSRAWMLRESAGNHLIAKSQKKNMVMIFPQWDQWTGGWFGGRCWGHHSRPWHYRSWRFGTEFAGPDGILMGIQWGYSLLESHDTLSSLVSILIHVHMGTEWNHICWFCRFVYVRSLQAMYLIKRNSETHFILWIVLHVCHKMLYDVCKLQNIQILLKMCPLDPTGNQTWQLKISHL